MGGDILHRVFFLFQNKTVECAIFTAPISLCLAVFPGTLCLFGRLFDNGNISLLFG